MLPDQLNVALKEWDVVCQALENGRQMLLLRKGGIIEAIGGFELEQQRFLLFPTFLHQKREMLKPEALGSLKTLAEEPQSIRITGAAEVTDILRVTDRKQMDALSQEHIWEPPLIDMRFNYRPQNPLYLLLVRAYRLAEAVTIANTPGYAGCKSWVPLDQSVDCRTAIPAIDDSAYETRRERLRASIHV